MDTLTRNAIYFVNKLLNFLNLPNVRSIINEQQIITSGKFESDKISRISIIGAIHGILGYIDIIPMKQNSRYKNIRRISFLERSNENYSSIKSHLINIDNNIVDFESSSLEITNKIFIIRIFLLRELPTEFIFLLRNYVLTTT